MGEHPPLPEVFREGGERRRRPQGNPTPLHERVYSVMGLVQKHEGEYRRWHPDWGTFPGLRENQDWQRMPAVGGGLLHEFLLTHHQLQVGAITSSTSSDLQSARQTAQQMAMSGSGSTIVRPKAGQPLAVAFEARNVFIVNLPELFLKHLNTRTAAELYEEWLTCEVIIGRKPPRGHNRAR